MTLYSPHSPATVSGTAPVTNLAGIPEWLSENALHADIRYVDLPPMINADEPIKEELPAFEKRLAKALMESIDTKERIIADVSKISWESMAREVTK